MKPRSIRFRLTLWYSVVLALALGLFGVASWIGVRAILFRTVDEELVNRIGGVRMFMENQTGSLSAGELRDEFQEYSLMAPGGDLFQVQDEKGVWLYRSAPLAKADGRDLRFVSSQATVRGKAYTIQAAAPVHEITQALATFGWMLAILIPGVLAVAGVGGWWMSRRALQPVDSITAAARSIGERSLSRRLPVPPANDELQRLSQTLNQMLTRLDDSFQRVTRFTADASHELRTPVSLIRTTAELALRKQRGEPEYRAALTEILQESERTTDLIENLLALAHADSGKAALTLEPLDLGPLAHELAASAHRLAAQNAQTFRLDSPLEGLPVLGDRTVLRRLFVILLDNAIKYTPENGQITLTLRRWASSVEIEVADTGIGIPDEDLAHIFERFFRADKARSRDSGGAGLGLALAKWIVEAHGGTIHATSAAGGGSRFSVQLPPA